MALQGSGAISIGNIRSELGSGSGSLRTLSGYANKGTPDSMSEFFNFNAANISVIYSNIESWFGGDANTRFYIWNADGTNLLSEWWVWGDVFGQNLSYDTGVTIKSGYRIQVYPYNWCASSVQLEVYKNGSNIYANCAWCGVGPFEFYVYSGDSVEIIVRSNQC